MQTYNRSMDIDNNARDKIVQYQKNEITEYHIYMKLAQTVKEFKNKATLEKIANDELRHYEIWKKYTQQEVRPYRFRIWKYYVISRILGFTFGVKLMERGEENAQKNYTKITKNIEEAKIIFEEEEEHERKLIELLDEELLQYTGSMILGLNDALVELTGALAGFTLALRNTKLIALVGLVTGIAAALSMSSSEYLSIKSEDTGKNPLKGSLYTGGAYLITVLILIHPYLLFNNYYFCLGATLGAAVLIIFLFNYYISVAKGLPFVRHFLEMFFLSLGVAAVSFFIGLLLRIFMKIDI